MPQTLEPLLGTLDLALTKRGRALRLAGELAVGFFDAGGDQVIDAKGLCDGRGYEGVGGRDQSDRSPCC